jgi:hypothetical protein
MGSRYVVIAPFKPFNNAKITRPPVVRLIGKTVQFLWSDRDSYQMYCISIRVPY